MGDFSQILGGIGQIGGQLLGGLLGGIFNAPKVQGASPVGTYLTMSNGKRYLALASYAAVHKDVSKQGKVTRLGDGQNTVSYDDGDITFLLLQPDDVSQTTYQLWAFNNSLDTDYYLSFTVTNSQGLTGNPFFVLPRNNQPSSRNTVELTSNFAAYKEGHYVLVPVQVWSTPTNPGTVDGSGNKVQQATCLGSFRVQSIMFITSAAPFLIYTSTAGAVNLTWTVDDTNTLTGFSVSSTLAVDITVTLTPYWHNPRYSEAVTIAVPSQGSASGEFPTLGRPIQEVDVAAYVSDTSAMTTHMLFKDLCAAQEEAGLSSRVTSLETAKPRTVVARSIQRARLV